VVRHAARTGPGASDRIDSVVVHPLWGWLVLGAIMTVLFVSIFTLAEYPMNWIDTQVPHSRLGEGVMPPGDLRDLITDGAVAGVGAWWSSSRRF